MFCLCVWLFGCAFVPSFVRSFVCLILGFFPGIDLRFLAS